MKHGKIEYDFDGDTEALHDDLNARIEYALRRGDGMDVDRFKGLWLVRVGMEMAQRMGRPGDYDAEARAVYRLYNEVHKPGMTQREVWNQLRLMLARKTGGHVSIPSVRRLQRYVARARELG